MWQRIGRRMIIFVVVLYAAWITGLVLLQERIIFPGWTSRSADQNMRLPARGESLWIDIGRGQRVEAWFIPGSDRTADDPGPLVVFGHGNGELIDDNGWALYRYIDLGVSVLLPEFRGYGRSGGTPGQKGLTADAIAFYDLAVARPEVDATRVFFHGRSIGGGVICQLAAARKPAAMILESTFASMSSMTWQYFAPPFLLRHPFRSDRVVAKLDVPMLIMHGSRDEIIPVSHGRKLHELAKNSRYIEVMSRHNDFPPDEDAYWKAIRAFLREQGLLD